jgi:hypothetical protein
MHQSGIGKPAYETEPSQTRHISQMRESSVGKIHLPLLVQKVQLLKGGQLLKMCQSYIGDLGASVEHQQRQVLGASQVFQTGIGDRASMETDAFKVPKQCRAGQMLQALIADVVEVDRPHTCEFGRMLGEHRDGAVRTQTQISDLGERVEAKPLNQPAEPLGVVTRGKPIVGATVLLPQRPKSPNSDAPQNAGDCPTIPEARRGRPSPEATCAGGNDTDIERGIAWSARIEDLQPRAKPSQRHG